MKLGQLIVDTGVLVAHPCDKLMESKCPGFEKDKLHRIISAGNCSKARYVGGVCMRYGNSGVDGHELMLTGAYQVAALLCDGEQIAAKNAAPSLKDSFVWCGWHSDHDTLTGVQAVLTDSTGTAVPNPDPQAGLYVKNRRGEILKANIPPGYLVYPIGETSQILSSGTLQTTTGVMRTVLFHARNDVQCLVRLPGRQCPHHHPVGRSCSCIRAE
ncbi:hypothetical protein PF005_g25280 [Phytophthora fragariae]|uniref:Uncharacterized protein n=1 Tax=Phytophthora fragariae TaxID=53985 RepID=A0A6A3VYV3_9STRA|nr:hypothetical protein PF009_g20067 [Phytophthora fragariae]KAE9073986.1 hypothetical protein PF010_g24862 [Phytophthora fragariae]KAE9090610.1 hypothetical protein PF007_g19176 [Phytophthora fragariae]KAE9120753.1 hypothetical protein PF006_g18059 [Phytophthora fragariae]KAE9175714.1 hypothetical protein PF005_g25280 [Phytophthora fragariae]